MTWTTRPRSDRGSLSVVEAGRGPLVVLIHGVGLQAEAWGAQIEALSSNYRVLAVDMPGHGCSDRLAGTPVLAGYTDAIAGLIDRSCAVFGHSFGAMIALDLAARYPERVTRVAALNAIFRRSARAKAAVQARAGSLDGRTVADPSAPLVRWFGTSNPVESAACRRWLCAVDPAGYRDAYTVFAQEDGPPDTALAALHCPALFLTGADEPNSTPAMSHAMAALAPQGQAKVLADAAHMLPMTHATQTNEILHDFLALQTQRI